MATTPDGKVYRYSNGTTYTFLVLVGLLVLSSGAIALLSRDVFDRWVASVFALGGAAVIVFLGYTMRTGIVLTGEEVVVTGPADRVLWRRSLDSLVSAKMVDGEEPFLSLLFSDASHLEIWPTIDDLHGLHRDVVLAMGKRRHRGGEV